MPSDPLRLNPEPLPKPKPEPTAPDSDKTEPKKKRVKRKKDSQTRFQTSSAKQYRDVPTNWEPWTIGASAEQPLERSLGERPLRLVPR